METGDLSEWDGNGGGGGGEFNSDGGDSFASTDQAHTGDWSAKLVLDDGNGGTRLFRWNETRVHDQAYYSAWYYFPVQYQVGFWWNIFQWKSKLSESVNDPFWQMGIWNRENGNMYVNLYDWQNRETYDQAIVDVPIGQWFHLECFYDKGSNNDGQVQCWQDGQELWNLTGVSTFYPGGDMGWSVNNYGEDISPTPRIYVDDVTISRTSTWPGN